MNGCLHKGQIEERFFIRGRMEILNVLNDLILRYEPVTITFNEGADYLVTHLLEARDKVLIFESASDNVGRLHLLQSSAYLFEARPDGILVQFSCEKAEPISWDDSEVLSVPLPQCIARLQRQESLRIRMPAANGLVVQLYGGNDVSLGAWPLHDLSVGGLGVSMNDPASLSIAESIIRASLHLPNVGVVDGMVKLCHASGLTGDDSNPGCHIGLGFCDLPIAMRALIQRYIINLEHQGRSAITESDAGGNDDA